MSSSDDKYNKLLSHYSELQKKNKNITISEEKKREITNLIDSGELFKEIGLSNEEIPAQKQKNIPILTFHYNVESLTIHPRENVQYAKETQTTKEPMTIAHYEHVDSPRVGRVVSPKFLTALEWDDEFEMKFCEPINENNESVMNISKRKATNLTDDEKQGILESDNFLDFFDRASLMVENCLVSDVDIFTDYAGNYDDERSLTNRKRLLEPGKVLISTTNDDRWSRNRIVTGLQWSPHHSDQLLASYYYFNYYHHHDYNLSDSGNNTISSATTTATTSHEPDGVCLLWNIKAAEHQVLHYQSPITTVAYAYNHNSLVVGGTYSGQVVLWDIRSNKRTPVQRTLLSANSHTHPIVAMSTVTNAIGSRTINLDDSLVTLSSDGKMCCWRLEMMSHPQDSVQLVNSRTKEINSTCMDMHFPSSSIYSSTNVEETNYSQMSQHQFLIGAEDGSVYTGNRTGNKSGECVALEGQQHSGPVMSVSVQHQLPYELSSKLGSLCLSCSVDYSVKLWSTSNNLHQSNLLFTLDDRSDYVYDTDWCPNVSSTTMFACVDGAGHLEVWNLLSTFEEPIAKEVIDSQSAISRCKWHPSGSLIATGDDMGKVRIHGVNESGIIPRTVDQDKYNELLSQLRMESDNIIPVKEPLA